MQNHIFIVFICLYSGRRRLFPVSKRPTTSKTMTNHRKAVKTGSKPGARGARGTPRGRPGLKVPGNPPLKSPALGLLVPGDPHTLPEGVMLLGFFHDFLDCTVRNTIFVGHAFRNVNGRIGR